MKIPCTYVSVWDGGVAIESAALFDPDTGVVSEIQTAPLSESQLAALDVLENQHILVCGHCFDVRENENGELAAVRTYGVFYTLEGYAEVKATSEVEAWNIADKTLRYCDVSWNEDWHPTHAQLEDCFPRCAESQPSCHNDGKVQ